MAQEYLGYNNEEIRYITPRDPRESNVVQKINELQGYCPDRVDDEQISGCELEKGILNKSDVSEVEQLRSDMNSKMDKSALLDAGIKEITWSTVRSEISVTTVEDPYKDQRPSGTNTRYWVQFDGCPYFKNRQLYRVTFDGTVYDNLVCDYGILVDEDKGTVHGTENDIGGAWQLIGNKNLYDSRYESTGEPFCILYIEHGGMHDGGAYYYGYQVGKGILLTASASTATLKIERANITQEDLPKSLFNNFGYGDRTYQNIANSTYPRTSLGQGNIVGRGSFAIGNDNVSTGQFAVAEGFENIASGYTSHSQGHLNTSSGIHSHAEGVLNVSSAVGSHAQGGRNTASAGYAHAEGSMTKASNWYTHAQGFKSTASGGAAHAQGEETKASGYTAHAQGYLSQASGEISHAQGNKTIASGQSSHTQGQHTKAIGQSSHSEGASTEANAPTSHAQGTCSIATSTAPMGHAEGQSTISNGRNQHVQGRFNIQDDSDINTANGKNARKYAHIVGNGTSDTNRSNAHTLDWDGNAWYAGTVEGTAMILKSPDGSRFKVTVGNDGTLSATKL